MKILGIDPGTALTGWGFIEYTAPDTYTNIQYGTITTPANQALHLRLHTIHQDLTQLIQQTNPDVLSIEKLFFNSNAKTALSVGHARGVIILAGMQTNLQIAEYTPLQIKQAITGYGRADKSQIQLMITQLLKLKTIPRPDDAADGLAAALTHAFTAKS